MTGRAAGLLEQLFLALDGFRPMHVVVRARLDAGIDPDRLATAMVAAQAAHPLLRARIGTAGVPFWHPDAGPAGLTVRDGAGGWLAVAETELATSFRRDGGPLWRVTLLRDAGGGADLLVCFHHALGDAHAGMRLLAALLGHAEGGRAFPPAYEIHAAAVAGLPAPPASLPLVSLTPAGWHPRLSHRRLEAGLVDALGRRARQEEASLQGALAAALLPATGRAGGFSLTSPVSVQAALGGGQDFTLAVAEVTTAHAASPDTPFWTLAREVSAAVRDRAVPERLLPAHLVALSRLAEPGLLTAAIADIGRFTPDRLGLTNLGRVAVPGASALDFAVVPPATQLVLAAVTGGDGSLGLTLTRPDPLLGAPEAEALMDKLVARLSAASQEGEGLVPGVDLSALSPAKRALLMLRLQQQQQQRQATAPTRSPLSYNQRSMWLLSRMAPDSAAYTLPFAVEIDGLPDAGPLEAALGLLRRRHDVLDACFPLIDGQPVQEPAPGLPLEIRQVDAQGWGEDRLHGAIADAYAQPFDLEQGLGWRAALFDRGGGRFVLFLALHHITIDFWSLALLARDLRACLAHQQTGSPLPPAPARRYADFTAAQRAWLAGPAGVAARAYWRERLAGPLPVLDLPTDRPRPAVQGFRGASVRFALGTGLTAAARAVARDRGVTLFALLAAACQALLHRWAGAAEVLLGTPTAGRADEGFAATIGDFINPMVLRAGFADQPSFATLLSRTAADAAASLGHSAYPFPLLLEELAVVRDPSRPPIFQAMVVLQNQMVHVGDGTGFRALDIDLQGSQLDLAFEFRPEGDGLSAEIKYDSDLFDADSIDRLRGHLLTLLSAALADPDRPVADLPLLDAAGLALVTRTWNDTALAEPVPHPLVLLRARERSEAPAVAQGASVLTHAGLWARSGALAGWLAAQGIGPGDRVGICLDRTPDMVAALIAVWRAGAAYVPLDPAHPADRLAFIVGDAGCALVLVDAGTAQVLAASGCRLAELPAHADAAPPVLAPDMSSPAYILYTSGTTGRPKGVVVSHHNLGNFLVAMRGLLGFGPGDRLLAVTTLSFDIAGLELFLPLSVGAVVELATAEEGRDGVKLAGRLAVCKPSFMQMTPAGWRLLLAAGWRPDPGLTMLVGGEALPRDLADVLLPAGAGCILWNMFGPTETTIWSTAHMVERSAGPVPIGRPVGNTRVYIVDAAGRPVPVGVTGELLIGGDGVAMGYHNRPDLTAQRFGDDPFVPGGRVYRTGDLARWRGDGVLLFQGRADHQVKLRGFRIELEEIEAVLASHPGVAEAVAAVCPGADGEGRLAAWIVPHGAAPGTEALRAHLAVRLPPYMLPSAWTFLAGLPRTSNGKIDRKALPDPAVALATASLAPRTGVEERLAGLWREVLGRDSVGVNDNFFDLGGHSLLLATLQARLNADLADILPPGGIAMTDLFRLPTIAGLAGMLAGGDADEGDDARDRAGLRRAALARRRRPVTGETN
ncbi:MULTISPECIES: non-ribosomal peptide synthetase [unclassified Azospirillum]|uniref:non-ribosomal peptide synthetase n=1 Tax=unclassified Azospirillum TaxID=2630922 RepID=UPI000B65E9FB|nr:MULTISPECIES: non-ribosomal peptide synthetase [unclassified Azospirillum]SNS94666.1 amino acid adenylation domain-containing protein [Azospirillum sp. RU38E]SNT11145.1 amino acid adenylation domain-containing protein [Azospirillum sp. RU37A]